MRNSCKVWTQEELYELDDLMQHRLPMRHISKVMGRSDNAIRNAFRNILFHQLLKNSPEQVAKKYGMNIEDLYDEIVDPKYSIEDTSSKGIGLYTMALATFLAVGGAYYAHVLFHNWSMIQNYMEPWTV